jgi:hypothetical protein
MGAAAMTLSGGEYAIHGTNAPGTIGRFVSHGCIRMYNEDIMDLYSWRRHARGGYEVIGYPEFRYWGSAISFSVRHSGFFWPQSAAPHSTMKATLFAGRICNRRRR